MGKFASYIEMCEASRPYCFCGKPRHKEKVYCLKHLIQHKELQDEEGYEPALTLEWINSHFVVNVCAGCEGDCPEDDYLCENCRV